MRFWFTHNAAFSLHDQIVQQVSLGIQTGELAALQRLPSVRALAQRHGIHPNTVSNAYQTLQRRNLINRRQGRGVYVNAASASAPAVDGISSLALSLVRLSRAEGQSDDHLLELVRKLQQRRQPLVLVEPDFELARIVTHECNEQISVLSELCTLAIEDYPNRLRDAIGTSIPAVLPSKANAVREALAGSGIEPFVLAINPVAQALGDRLPLSRDHLAAIVSHWPEFLRLAQGMLIAAGFSPDALMIRDAKQAGWRKGLRLANGVVCDSFTATFLKPSPDNYVFKLISPDSIEALHKRCDSR